MKKVWILLLAVTMLFVACTPGEPTAEETATPTDAIEETATPTATATATLAPTPTPTPAPVITWGENLLPEASSTFTGAAKLKDTAWTGAYGSIKATVEESGGSEDGPCLKFTKSGEESASYHTIAINLVPFIKEPGTYRISFRFKVEAEDAGTPFATLIRTDSEYSFSEARANGQTYYTMSYAEAVDADEWGEYEDQFMIEQEDIDAAQKNKGAQWNFCLHLIRAGITAVYFDDVSLQRREESESAGETSLVEHAETWIAQEMTFTADKAYKDPLLDVEVDLILSKGSESYTIPFFWDGGKTWRVRFACTSVGEWTWKTVCSDTTDSGLHGKTGTISCTAYSGNYEIYKRGFVKTDPDKKYFVYDDGTPFFYLGDTHWSLGSEPLNLLNELLDKRIEQKFTVFQSEPLGTTFLLTDGFSAADLVGLRAFDERFAAVAAKGFLHANACLFFPSNMSTFIEKNGGYSEKAIGNALHGSSAIKVYDLSDQAKTMLKKLARLWAARYSAYPVLWTLGQEVDNDFYWDRDDFHDHEKWSYYNNPYRLLAIYLGEADPYKHPLSAHQEGTNYTTAKNSAFRDISAHTWYAAQWKQNFNLAMNYAPPIDYWSNGQGKPVINYEGKYCYLWTKNFGARMQGWMSYLNGVFGYGWGGQDTWCYQSTYDEDASTSDGVDTITSADKKKATWQDSLEYPSAYQVGYMREFFEKTVGDWYNLIPRFGSPQYMAGDTLFFMLAGNSDNSKIVVYFYNFSDSALAENPNSSAADAAKTGTLKNLTSGAAYRYQWFNPVTGKIESEGTFTADASGTWKIPNKSSGDMVLYVYK